MLKTPEQYFADLNFDPPDTDKASHALNSGERVFVEKYLGLDMLQGLEPVAQAPRPQLQRQPVQKPAYRPVIEPKIEVAPKKIEVSPQPSPIIDRQKPVEAPKPAAPEPKVETAPAEKAEVKPAAAPTIAPAAPKIVVAPEAPAPAANKEAEAAPVSTPAPVVATPRPETPARTPAPAVVKAESKESPVKAEASQPERAKAAAASPPAPWQVEAVAPPQTATELLAETAKATAPPMVTMRDLANVETSIRMVSFYVDKQLFLLPVSGIHEVLRHMELIKVPQAPRFVAGAINLRGSVMPLIHLSALLTNQQDHIYNERSFIIVYGSENMRLGLIIDKINSMHMLDSEKIIWNVESRLGDAGDFLCAIANIDDRVCGILAPEMITQKLLSS